MAPDARAQVDINIESRIESLTPRPLEQLPLVPQTIVTPARTERRPRPELEAAVARRSGAGILSVKKMSPAALEAAINALPFKERNRTIPAKVTVIPRQTEVSLSLPIGLSYDANALRTNTSHQGDFIWAGSSAFRAVIPIGTDKDLDQVVVNASAGPTRYSRFSRNDLDTVGGSVLYQRIREHYKDPRFDTRATKTFETIEWAVSNNTSFEPTFRKEKVYFITPSIAWSRQNIQLSDAVYDNPKVPKDEAFRYYADVAVKLGHSFSDIKSLQNANLTATGKVGWRIPESLVTLSANASAAGKWYPDFPGGREDLVLSIGPRVDHAILRNFFSVSLFANYIRQFSTVSTARFDTVVAAAQLTIMLTPPKE